MTRAIRRGDGDTLFDIFTQRRAIRRSIAPQPTTGRAESFGRPHPETPEEPLPRPYGSD